MEYKHKIRFLVSFFFFIPFLADTIIIHQFPTFDHEFYLNDLPIIHEIMNATLCTAMFLAAYSVFYHMRTTSMKTKYKVPIMFLLVSFTLFAIIFTSYSWFADPIIMNVVGPNSFAIQEFMKKYPDARSDLLYDSFLQPGIEIFYKDGESRLWLVVKFYNVIFIQSNSYLRCATDQSVVHIEHESNVIDFLQNYDCPTNGHTYTDPYRG